MGEFSFVYVHFGLVLFVLGLWVMLFLTRAIIDHKYIMRHHNTISSYCSDPTKFGNRYRQGLLLRIEFITYNNNTMVQPLRRFLVAATCVMGSSLACLLVEEYNSRDDSDPRFWPEVIACGILLPCVGIFHTNGGGKVTHYDVGLGPFNLPVIVSSCIHGVSALGFLTISLVMNTWYSIEVLESPAGKAFLVLALLDDIIFLLFIALQGAIFLAHKFTDREERNSSCAKVEKHICCYNYSPDSINVCDTLQW